MDALPTLAGLLIAIVAAFLLFFGLVLAPWQVLLLLLVLGWMTIWWLMKRNQIGSLLQESEDLVTTSSSEHSDSTATPQVGKDYPLVYRGASYQPILPPATDPPAKIIEISGKYRGSIWKKSPAVVVKPTEVRKIEITGKYRGCVWKISNNQK
ncbi:DUF4278 domain-containing protein [Leptothermofonsia sp. ETS-13]|uniref:DUF4278 domain-containing protein n=1 Tax=Leptothermofonsia sp. ETS-13 TaxID=3035696 RepID=UPI003B9DD613